MNRLHFLITKNDIKVFISSEAGLKNYCIDRDPDKDKFYKVYDILIRDNVSSEDEKIESLINLLDVKKNIIEYFDTHLGEQVRIENGILYYGDNIIKNDLVAEIQELEESGVSTSALKNFLSKLLKNPSYDSINELFLFLKHNRLPIKENGNFLAYKKITEDYLDIYTRTIVNKPGVLIPRKDRSEVDSDRSVTCSVGYHVCGYDYLNHYGIDVGNRVLQVEVNPEDVVSVPVDYNNAKMRVTYYKVIEEIENWRDYKIRDYYVSDFIDFYESWEEYTLSVKKPEASEEEFDDFIEDSFLDDDWTEELYTIKDTSLSKQEKLLDHFEKFTPFSEIEYSYQGTTYKGFIICTIPANSSAREMRNEIFEEVLTPQMMLSEIKTAIKRDVSSRDRLLVLVFRKNSELVTKPFFLTPPTSAKEG